LGDNLIDLFLSNNPIIVDWVDNLVRNLDLGIIDVESLEEVLLVKDWKLRLFIWLLLFFFLLLFLWLAGFLSLSVLPVSNSLDLLCVVFLEFFLGFLKVHLSLLFSFFAFLDLLLSEFLISLSNRKLLCDVSLSSLDSKV
jgi:hypothetical protein